MKILVTGGTGFIGKWILKEYSDKHEFIIVGTQRNKKEVELNNNTFKYIYSDYSKDSLIEALYGIDAVIHLACKRPGKDHYNQEMGEYFDNIKIAVNLLDACKEKKIKKIVMASTIAAYSEKNILPWKEDMKTNPKGFYGVGKVCVENIAEYYNEIYKLNICNLRFAQVVGVGEREGFILMTFINNAINGDTLKVWGQGIGRREYIYIKDVVSSIMACIYNENARGIFNVGTGISTSNLELAQMINKTFDNEGNLEILADKIEDTREFRMDCNKIYQELGWKSEWSLKDSLNDMKTIINK